ncbi:putative SNU66/SART1 family protein [Rosa chinensis]|uniref:Putative SNU66/SART1 family protein n=1 Tax=Rosa chinensis TaxID=74649 RepID=A0A2P6SJ74_ROSCH|nr:putative SNU66/SART1 family protein [Rosa chinensis]
MPLISITCFLFIRCLRFNVTDGDMLENVELGEQKQRDDAYKAAKKKTGIYADKFNDDPTLEKKILPQYDDPAADEVSISCLFPPLLVSAAEF